MRLKRGLKISHCDAKTLLKKSGVDFSRDFHALSYDHVSAIAEAARLARYRKSKSAPGSTARMYFQLLTTKRGCKR